MKRRYSIGCAHRACGGYHSGYCRRGSVTGGVSRQLRGGKLTGNDAVSGGGYGAGASERLNLFRYLTADNAEDYLAVMRLFSSTLLADLSAVEVSELLRDSGHGLDADAVEERCRKLVRWGNLIPSVRDARVPTVAAYRNSRARFQMSTLGGRVHRQIEDVLKATDGAREVARELLGHTVGVLEQILEQLTQPSPDAETLAADVTTVFNNQALFSESARDFYSYLGSVLTRYDLAGEEYSTLKGLLLEYVELISNDVARHCPAIVDRLNRLAPFLTQLVDRLAALPGLDGGSEPVERLPGRTKSDWAQLSAWYSGGSGTSGPAQLRVAAEQALGQLITNAKRMLSSGGTGVSRRADLLRLAGLLAISDTDGAQRAFAATFGVYGMRHLGHGPEESDTRVPPTTSWWDAPAVEVPISLRERGDRTARGRSSRVPDPGMDRARLLAEAEREESRRRAAVAELIAVRALHGARVSDYARELLLDLLGDFMATHPMPAQADQPCALPFEDLGMDLVVTYREGERTEIFSPTGPHCVIHGLIVCVEQIGGQQVSGGQQ
ncbi:DUF2397 domain-containing protein [Streptomyces sp. NPDC002853]